MNAKIELGRLRRWLNETLFKRLRLRLVNDEERLALELPQLIGWATEELDEVVCIQVGANDGVINDPLCEMRRKLGWRTFLLEPNPPVFDRLRQNISSESGSTALQVALGVEAGSSSFFVPDRAHIPESVGRDLDIAQMASLDRQKVMGELAGLSPNGVAEDAWVREFRVEVLDWKTLIDKHLLRCPEIVVIDAEGYDADLVEAFPFEIGSPRIIVCEHLWMSRDSFDHVCKFLLERGYACLATRNDLIAIHGSLTPQVRERHFGRWLEAGNPQNVRGA